MGRTEPEEPNLDGGWMVVAGDGDDATVTWEPLRYVPEGSPRWWLREARQQIPFQNIQLNAVGWSALVAPGALVGLAAGVWCRSARRGLVVAVAGASATVAVVWVRDRVAFRRSETTWSVSDDEAVARRVADSLQARGVPVVVEQDLVWEEGELPRWQIRFRQRHRKQVDRAIDEAI